MKFAKLRGRIKEKGYTESSFADKLNISANTLRSKLNGKTQFKISEIKRIRFLLEIDSVEEYFF